MTQPLKIGCGKEIISKYFGGKKRVVLCGWLDDLCLRCSGRKEMAEYLLKRWRDIENDVTIKNSRYRWVKFREIIVSLTVRENQPDGKDNFPKPPTKSKEGGR